MPQKSSKPLKSVSLACDVLDTLHQLGGVGVTELAKELDCSKSTAYRQLKTLYDKEFIVKEGDQYQLGFKCLGMAAHVRDQINNYDIIGEELTSLAEETGETAQFATEEHSRVVYLYKAYGTSGVRTSSNVGTREHFHSTSLGKVMMSYMSEDRVEEIIERHGLPKKTANTISDRASLFAALQEIRERGYAIDDEENVEGLRCVAAPVLQDNDVMGAISVSGPSRRIEGERFDEELPEIVTRAANVIELNSKFS